MATFSEADYQNLVDILNLGPEYLETASYLRNSGKYLEEQDVRLNTDNVTRVKEAIAGYLSAQSAYNAAIESDTALGVASQSVQGEYSITWANGNAAAQKYSNYTVAMRRHKATITRYLNWTRSNPYSGRVTKGVS